MKEIYFIALFTLVIAGCANKNVSVENETKTPRTQMTGAYTEGRSISKEDLAIFNKTYKGDVALTPVSVSTQVVAGTNYMFICKDKLGNNYKVVIYEKLPCYGGESEVTSVEKL